ncbi:hypothetical protein DID73_00880 [Candidatus Marinamargulisbacteria bacterium SCGC AG-343-K17]|nr:hypothetical protein DID73_00880 [Candidatus Marinamargulisbacteria bacterium SCGC AG-343-K17]
MKTHVTCIILNYNHWEMTQECITSLESSDYENLTILIIDNNSLKKIDQLTYKNNHYDLFDNNYNNEQFEHHPIKVNSLYTIKNSINGGFSNGVNIGIKFAQTYLNTDYFWFLNNDTITNNSTLSELLESTNQSTITGSTIFDMNSKPLRSKGSLTCLALSKPYSKKYTTHYIPFTSALISKTIIENVGLLNEDLFLYYEDADYCKKCIDHGYVLKVSKKSIIKHNESASQKLEINKSACPDWLPIYSKKHFMKTNQYPAIYIITSLLLSALKRLKNGEFKKYKDIIMLLINEKKLLKSHHYYQNK